MVTYTKEVPVKLLKKISLWSKFLFLIMRGEKAYYGYDRVSDKYDEFFLTKVYIPEIKKRIFQSFIDDLNIKEGENVLDLACGTGLFTYEIAKRIGESGKILGIDISEKMLDIAREKLQKFQLNNIEFLHGDMLENLYKIESSTYNVVACEWGICYSKPNKVIKETSRILKPGGRVGIIDTKADAFKELMGIFIEVAEKHSYALNKYIDLHLFRNAHHLENVFKKVGLSPVKCGDGERQIKFKDGNEIFDWMSDSGVTIGFTDIFREDKRELVVNCLRETINSYFNSKNEIILSHTFIVGIAEKPYKDYSGD